MHITMGGVHRAHGHGGSQEAAPSRGCCPVGLLLLALGVLVAALPGAAQPRGTLPVVGVLAPDTPAVLAHPTSDLSVFRQGLRELGYIEGQTITIAYRFAEDKLERLPTLAAELVGLQVDLMVAYAFQAARAAQQATQTLPIVMVRVGRDPVEAGLVKSLARPGGNLTGLTVLGVPRTAQGIDSDVFERLVVEHRPKAIFLNTTLQNPTGATFGMASAFRLLQIAEHRLQPRKKRWK